MTATRGRRVSRRRQPKFLRPLHRQQSMPLRSNPIPSATYRLLVPCNSSLFTPTHCLAKTFLRRDCPLQYWSARDTRGYLTMAPKQATLGYVKSSQTTLECGDTTRIDMMMYEPTLTVWVQEVLWETEWKPSKATVEARLFDETEGRRERRQGQRRARVITGRCKD